MMLSIFSHAYRPFVCLLWINVCSDPLPIFNWVVLLLLSCKSPFCILITSPLSEIWFTKFSPILVIFFHFLDGVLKAQVFSFDDFQPIYFSFCCLWEPLIFQVCLPSCRPCTLWTSWVRTIKAPSLSATPGVGSPPMSGGLVEEEIPDVSVSLTRNLASSSLSWREQETLAACSSWWGASYLDREGRGSPILLATPTQWREKRREWIMVWVLQSHCSYQV